MAEKQQVELTQLDVRDLGLIKEQIEGEVQSLTQSAVALQKAAAEFGKSGRSIEQLASREEGADSMCYQYSTLSDWYSNADHTAGCSTLVPLTGSLYVKGTLAGADKVLLDVGTGYYVEASYPKLHLHSNFARCTDW